MALITRSNDTNANLLFGWRRLCPRQTSGTS
ncbi:hypothetical protein [Paraburkholderia sp. Tr-20389]